MKKVSKKNKTKKIFIQDWGTYSNETIVSIGSSPGEVKRFMEKAKIKKEPKEWLLRKFDELENIKPSESGFCLLSDKGWTFLWLRDFDDTWDFWSTLIHEISHLIDHVLREHKLMWKETEACAYQTEYLFNSIRRKIK